MQAKSVSSSLSALDVALVCLLSQHPRMSDIFEAFATALQGTNAATLAEITKNFIFAICFKLMKIPFLPVLLQIIVRLDVSRVSLSKMHGPALMCDGIPGHALSPQMREVPNRNCNGESNLPLHIQK